MAGVCNLDIHSHVQLTDYPHGLTTTMSKISDHTWRGLFVERRKQPRKSEPDVPAEHLLSPEEQENEARHEDSGVVRRYLRLADTVLGDDDEHAA